jgi:arabinose-5-phosphate isomerase
MIGNQEKGLFEKHTFKKGDVKEVLSLAKRVIEIEAQAVESLRESITGDFFVAVELLANCEGRVVVSGIGKSGHVGRKIAATFASTGTAAFFVHPAEAAHGDLGMVCREDVVIMLSYSGETNELLTIVPAIKRDGAKLIAMTGNPSSSLAKYADVHLNVHVSQEACPLNLAPTASTTATLVMGDALAVAVLSCKGFTEEDFARSHPAGALGRRLLLHVADVMRIGTAVPMIQRDAVWADALVEMTSKGMGMTAVVDEQSKLLGIFTDGDLRRVLENQQDVKELKIVDLMQKKPYTVKASQLAHEAAALMEQKRVNQLLVVNDDQQVVGALNMHDLLTAKVL